MTNDLKFKVLALDTSTMRGSIALLQDGEIAGELRIASQETHSARLLRSIDFLLASLGWKLSDLGLVSVGIGPGSFTGIRIGISTAMGLAQTLKIPFCGISCLDAVASQMSFLESNIGVVLDAQRGQLYYAEYHCGCGKFKQTHRPILCFPVDLASKLRRRHLYLVGDAKLKYFENFKLGEHSWPKVIGADLFLAGNIGRLAHQRKRRWVSGEFLTAEPLYIRPPDAKKPKPKKT